MFITTTSSSIIQIFKSAVLVRVKDAPVAGEYVYLWPNSGLDYIIGTFTLRSADEERIGKRGTTDTAWTQCHVSYTNTDRRINPHTHTHTHTHTQTQIAHTESEKQIT